MGVSEDIDLITGFVPEGSVIGKMEKGGGDKARQKGLGDLFVLVLGIYQKN